MFVGRANSRGIFTKINTVAISVTLSILTFSANSQSATVRRSLTMGGETKLYAAPDASSGVIAILKPGDDFSPLADTLAGEGARWYLVEAKTGAIGWISGIDTDTKGLDTFFKPIPVEPSLALSNSVPSTSAGDFGPNTITVPVLMDGASVIVPVTFNGSLKAKLALDTGATVTVVSRRIANALALSPLGMTRVGTVAGIITVPLVRLGSLNAGEAQVRDLVVSVHDFSTDPHVEGLLGLDFLRHFHFSLDTRRSLMVLGRR